jgi:methylisocitrate lyase
MIMARTDAYAVDGMAAALDRAAYYIELGADMIFPEALTTLDEYQQFTTHIKQPILANITEFGKTPLFTLDELESVGVQLALYPLSAFRAMSKAALNTYQTILKTGTQQSVLNTMQTRDELYQVLDYNAFEKKMDLWEEVVDE